MSLLLEYFLWYLSVCLPTYPSFYHLCLYHLFEPRSIPHNFYIIILFSFLQQTQNTALTYNCSLNTLKQISCIFFVFCSTQPRNFSLCGINVKILTIAPTYLFLQSSEYGNHKMEEFNFMLLGKNMLNSSKPGTTTKPTLGTHFSPGSLKETSLRYMVLKSEQRIQSRVGVGNPS